MKAIALALLKAQNEMSNPTKSTENKFFKSKYADLNSVREAVIPILNLCGILVLQTTQPIDGRNYVKTMLIHAESGETIESLTEIVYKSQGDAQGHGSGMTYARRYALQAIMCLGADDDDGNKASELSMQKQKDPSVEDKIRQATMFMHSNNDAKNYYLKLYQKNDLEELKEKELTEIYVELKLKNRI